MVTLQCSICLGSQFKNNVALLDCSHVFHYECIRHWLRRKRNCPFCRAHTSMNTITRVTFDPMTVSEVHDDMSSNLFLKETVENEMPELMADARAMQNEKELVTQQLECKLKSNLDILMAINGLEMKYRDLDALLFEEKQLNGKLKMQKRPFNLSQYYLNYDTTLLDHIRMLEATYKFQRSFERETDYVLCTVLMAYFENLLKDSDECERVYARSMVVSAELEESEVPTAVVHTNFNYVLSVIEKIKRHHFSLELLEAEFKGLSVQHYLIWAKLTALPYLWKSGSLDPANASDNLKIFTECADHVAAPFMVNMEIALHVKYINKLNNFELPSSAEDSSGIILLINEYDINILYKD